MYTRRRLYTATTRRVPSQRAHCSSRLHDDTHLRLYGSFVLLDDSLARLVDRQGSHLVAVPAVGVSLAGERASRVGGRSGLRRASPLLLPEDDERRVLVSLTDELDALFRATRAAHRASCPQRILRYGLQQARVPVTGTASIYTTIDDTTATSPSRQQQRPVE